MKTINTYDVKISDGSVLRFRLTARAQLSLRKTFKGEETLQTIMEAVSDLDKAVAVLHESLTWLDNDNAITDGADAYDALVDSGMCGQAAWAGLLTGIAQVSGLLGEEQRDKLVGYIKDGLDSFMDDMTAPALYEADTAEATGKNA